MSERTERTEGTNWSKTDYWRERAETAERELAGLREAITAARLWLVEEHGQKRPWHDSDAAAARLYDALLDTEVESAGEDS